jgi:cytochrome c
MRRLVIALTLFAAPAEAQDAAAGQRVFGQCRACHSIEAGGRNGVGPNLHGIIGRRAAAIEGFRYSAAMRAKAEAGLTWDEAALRAYIANPREAVPGNAMTYVGLRNPQQMEDLIAYLRQAH